jgi:signal transduction histidine kinase
MTGYHRVLPAGLQSAVAAHVFIFVLVISICFVPWPAAGNDQRRRIYFLESLSATQPGAIRTIEGFTLRLKAKTTESFEIIIDYLEFGRFPDQAHADRSARFLAEKYAEAPPDVLIPLGRAAIPFMLKHRDIVAPQVPIIMVGVPAHAVGEVKALGNSIWVITECNFAKTLALAQRLQPEARNLVFLAGASDYDRSWMNDARRELEPYLDRYQTKYLVGLPYNEMLREVSHLSRDTIVMMSFVFVDGAGLPRIPPDIAAAVADASTAPVYSPVSTFFGRGVVGGYMDSYEAEGVAAADLALKVLSGKLTSELSPQTTPLHQYHIDARQLDRWGLSASNLPSDAVLAFREPTIWEGHRNAVLAASLISTLQVSLLGILLMGRRQKRLAEERQKAAEAEAAEQRQEVTHLMRVTVLGELSGAVAHEINQPLTAILWNAQAALALLAEKSPDLAEVRDAIHDIIQEDNRAAEVIQRLRNLLKKGERKSEQIDLNNLVDSTIALLKNELIDRHIEVEFNLATGLPAVSGDPVQLQQVLLNLFMNAMDAMVSTPNSQRRIIVSTRPAQSGAVEVLIRDRGPGLGPDDPAVLFKPFRTSKDHGLGLGLTICSTIAQAHGGKVTLANHEDGGAVAVFSLLAQGRLMAAQ